MTRKHLDDESTQPPLDSLPLFAPKPRALYSPDDPATSREAARRMLGTNQFTMDQKLAYSIVRDSPGCTAPELGQEPANHDPMNGSAESWRQRIGRRLNELERAGLIHRDGVRDGCSIWWPGSKSQSQREERT